MRRIGKHCVGALLLSFKKRVPQVSRWRPRTSLSAPQRAGHTEPSTFCVVLSHCTAAMPFVAKCQKKRVPVNVFGVARPKQASILDLKKVAMVPGVSSVIACSLLRQLSRWQKSQSGHFWAPHPGLISQCQWLKMPPSLGQTASGHFQQRA